MRKLDHENLVYLVEVHETEREIYMVFDHIAGRNLQELLTSNIKLQKNQIYLIIKGIATGLEYIHHLKIIHRDIKVENIFFTNDDYYHPIIADFGLATSEDQLEYPFPRCGTPGYVAPEILNFKSTNDKYTCISDIFGLGVIYHKL